MSGYRRFIAYVYEYQKGKKSSNCGFIKVEVKNENCSIEVHLHCPGLVKDIPCQIYGFVRKDGLMNGILLETCETEPEVIECQIETNALDMNGSGISLGKMSGMILTTQAGGFFGTEWDDQPIRPDNFRELKEQISYTIPDARPQNTVQTRDAHIDNKIANNTDSSDSFIERNFTNNTANDESNVISDMNNNDTEGADNRINANTENIENADDQKLSPELITTSQEIPAAPPPPIPTKPVAPPPPPHAPGKPLNPPPPPAPAKPLNPPPPPPAKPVTPPPPFEAFSPFIDGELITAWKIHPNDLRFFPRQYNSLRSNRFIQYGHYNFGHLLLGQRNDGQYILGVPGGYNQQERFMANMFGFPYFKESHYIELPRARGGYWYMLINAPDLNQ